MIQNKKVLVLYSGGLDSRLAIKLLKENDNEVEALFFNHPFNSDEAVKDGYLESENIALNEIDCYQDPWLSRFLDAITDAEYGYGKGYNPCKDCKIFIKKAAEEIARERNFDCIATGEVPGQRPMSQTKEAQKIIQSKISIKTFKPLKEIGIEGRSRQRQMQMAEEYGIDTYPSPAGGCLLADKQLKQKYKVLLENYLITPHTVDLMNIGRHFYFEENQEWYVVGRNEEECKVIDDYDQVIESEKGKPGVYYQADEITDSVKRKARELQKAYQKHEDQDLYQKYQKWKL